jgi:hypothetical protein
MKTFHANKIMEVYSYVNRTSEPENRIIEPSLNPDIFNKGINYSLLTQTVNNPTWFTNNYLAYKIPGRFLTQRYKAEFSSQSQQLSSGLVVTQQNNAVNLVGDSTRNSLNWSRNKLMPRQIMISQKNTEDWYQFALKLAANPLS